jgi:hypothetical protein
LPGNAAAPGTQDFTWDAADDLLMESTNAYIYADATRPTRAGQPGSDAVGWMWDVSVLVHNCGAQLDSDGA